ncbi:hypothetical protein GCM10027055_17510 [Janibacter alkaliphilus]|uniref:Nucleotidyltransferase n=1 Tax=Janibacter alkaliphilus TaxID=1069963 RepID=A0A852WYW8_9MICO|nr:hypothetical protein [Janibacter alkaliphilus]NYG35799.1 hypothetical protein [Janibacter alkaliphilus]
MTRSPDEYIVARRTLLDALDVLSEHTEAMVLVGAQAVYQRTGDVPGTGIPMTTDSDLAIDADLLADAPEMSGLLTDAGFSAASQPGHWISSHGIGLDLMGVPHQVPRVLVDLRASRGTTDRLPGSPPVWNRRWSTVPT